MKKYIIVIEKAASNFAAFCPDVPGCITVGDTVEETVINMKDALEFHLEEEIILPESHTIKYLQDIGSFENIAEEFYIARIEISLPQIA